MMKKTLALLLIVVMALSVFAGCGGGNQLNVDNGGVVAGDPIDGTDLKYDETFTIDYWVPDNTDLEMEGNYVDLTVEKTINAKINITEYESRDQYETLIAQQKIPALTYANAKIFGPKYGPMGAYIDWNAYLDRLPNVKKILSDERFVHDVANYTEDDGSLYQLPIPQTGYADVQGFLYRKDIFDKHDLKVPTNQEELLSVLRELKKLYPDSTPFVLRSLNGANMGGLMSIAELFNGHYTGFGTYNTLFRLDANTDTYYLAQTSNQMREAVQFLHDLYEEGLMHKSCLKMDTAQWTEAFTSNKSFIGFDKMDRIAAITMVGTQINPDFELAGAAPFGMGSDPKNTYTVSSTGGSFLVSADLPEEDLEKVLQYIDWLYSEKGIELTNWGIEGESYEVVDGEKQFKEVFEYEGSETAKTKGYEGSGLGVLGHIGYRDFDAYKHSQTPAVISAIDEITKLHTEPETGVRLTYTADEQRIFDTYFQSVYDECQAYFQKFIGCEMNPETDWDAYVSAVNAKIPAEMMTIHNDALARYRESHPEG